MSSFAQPRSRQSSANSFTTPPSPAVNDCALSFQPRTAKQPLYRPAALRRNNSATSDLLLQTTTPPLSPAPSSTDLKGSWLAGLAAVAAPWSPIGTDRDTSGPVRGTLLPKEQWKRDDTAVECADGDCQVRFGLIDRKHHCRRCGFVFCAAHSSRSSLLWTNAEDGYTNPSTPRATPRSTPRSSTLDIPSLASPASSGFSFNYSTTTPSSSPPTYSPIPVCARVCDSCFFSTTPLPTPPLPSPSLASYSHSPYSRALPLNTSCQPFVRSPLVSPSHSPPFHPPDFVIHGSGRTKSRSRSRQSSTASTSYSDHSTPPTSVSNDGSGYARAERKRGISPAESLRLKAAMLVEEAEDSEEEEKRREEETAFGSVAGQWSWNSWATF